MREPDSPTTARSYDNSTAEHARRRAVIAGGVNSNVRLSGTPVPLTFDRGGGRAVVGRRRQRVRRLRRRAWAR